MERVANSLKGASPSLPKGRERQFRWWLLVVRCLCTTGMATYSTSIQLRNKHDDEDARLSKCSTDDITVCRADSVERGFWKDWMSHSVQCTQPQVSTCTWMLTEYCTTRMKVRVCSKSSCIEKFLGARLVKFESVRRGKHCGCADGISLRLSKQQWWWCFILFPIL